MLRPRLREPKVVQASPGEAISCNKLVPNQDDMVDR